MIVSVLFFGACACALAIASALERRRDPRASLGGMFDRAMQDRAARVAILLIWWWLGWHFLAGQTL